MRGRDCVITMPIPLLSYCHGDGCDCLGLCVGVPLKKNTQVLTRRGILEGTWWGSPKHVARCILLTLLMGPG